MKKLLSGLVLVLLCVFIAPRVSAVHDIDFEELFENHNSIMMIIRPSTGEIVYINQAAAEFYGYPREVLIGMNINQINTLSEEEIAIEIQKAVNEERNFFIFRHRISNGEIRTVHVYTYPVETGGETLLFSIIIDQTAPILIQERNQFLTRLGIILLIIGSIVTSSLAIGLSYKAREAKKGKASLFEQQRTLTTLISNLPGVAYRRKNDPEFSMLYISDQIKDITGYSSSEFLSGEVKYGDLIHQEDKIRVLKHYLTISTPDKSVHTSYRLVNKAGEVRWVNVNSTCVCDKSEDGFLIIEGFIQDITSKKLTELEATYRKDLLQYIISHSHQGVAVFDKRMNYVFVSNEFRKMYHVDKDIIGLNHYEVFPDLPQKWRDAHSRCLKGESLHSDRDQFIRADGSIHFTRWSCQPWYDANKNIAGIIVYAEFITKLVETESKLQKAYERLQLVMDSMPIGIAVKSVSPGVEFNYMNENFPLIYGTTREVLERSDSFWDAVYEDPAFRSKLKKKVLSDIESGDPKRMIWEDVPISKNGKIAHYISAYATPIPNTNLLISTVIDVTERKQKELDIIYTSHHDYLTGLPNRRFFEEKIIGIDKPKNYPLLIALIDLNGLKLINDAYGHDVGDEALKLVSKALASCLDPKHFLARIGGDEFVVLCPNTTADIFETLREKITTKLESFGNGSMKYSLSIGYDVKTDESIKMEEVLKNAENNMYSNKILHGQSARNETITTLFNTLNEKYEDEKNHSDRVSQYCRKMGEKLKLSSDKVKELEFAGLMHDIGKITIPDNLLDKPGRLLPEEWEIMKKHTINGYQILKSADKYSRLAEYALTHHERLDGRGYPNGLKGDEIPLFSRIICIADAYEAMTANRPYRKALDQEVAIKELYRCSGTQFDGDLVKIFVREVLGVLT